MAEIGCYWMQEGKERHSIMGAFHHMSIGIAWNVLGSRTQVFHGYLLALYVPQTGRSIGVRAVAGGPYAGRRPAFMFYITSLR